MKTPDAAEIHIGSKRGEMKPQDSNRRTAMAGRRSSPMRIPQIPMEWMDPMSWRLPSGKALAEFALQAGFLAPLMLGGPSIKKRKKAVAGTDSAAAKPSIETQAGKGPEHSGSFRPPGIGGSNGIGD